jgi:carbonic anhydrase
VGVANEPLQNCERYAEGFDNGDLPLPAKGVAVVACTDARLEANRILGLEDGDAHVIRNADGVVSDDQIRLLATPQQLLGATEIVLSLPRTNGIPGFAYEAATGGRG